MAEITVTQNNASVFRVEVKEGMSTTVHDVTVNQPDLDRYGAGAAPEHLIRESFAFLLEREPKESILRSFTLPVIERYFAEYPEEIRKRLKG